MKSGAILIGMLAAYADRALVRAYAERGIVAFAMELMPRITRAQSMDVLSSQNNLAGYQGGDGGGGRVRPGAADDDDGGRHGGAGEGGRPGRRRRRAPGDRHGEAAGSRRLRHRRPAAAKEQVQSLGARFIEVEEGRPTPRPPAATPRKWTTTIRRSRGEVSTTREEAGHGHLHRAHPRASGAASGHRGDGEEHEAGIGHRRPGGREGGNCALSEPGKVVMKHGVQHRRPRQHARATAERCEPPLCAEPAQLRLAPESTRQQGDAASTGRTRS